MTFHIKVANYVRIVPGSCRIGLRWMIHQWQRSILVASEAEPYTPVEPQTQQLPNVARGAPQYRVFDRWDPMNRSNLEECRLKYHKHCNTSVCLRRRMKRMDLCKFDSSGNG